jgi:hypothetical protein
MAFHYTSQLHVEVNLIFWENVGFCFRWCPTVFWLYYFIHFFFKWVWANVTPLSRHTVRGGRPGGQSLSVESRVNQVSGCPIVIQTQWAIRTRFHARTWTVAQKSMVNTATDQNRCQLVTCNKKPEVKTAVFISQLKPWVTGWKSSRSLCTWSGPKPFASTRRGKLCSRVREKVPFILPWCK